MTNRYQAAFLKDLDKEEEVETPETAAQEPAVADTTDWKSRYGELRGKEAGMQADLRSKDEEIARLTAQLSEATEKQLRFPKTEEEIAEWAKKYPDVNAMVESIAARIARDTMKGTEDRLKELDQREAKAKERTAEQELKALHPDFEELKANPEFHEWVRTKSQMMQDALYKNSTNAQAAADVISLYKAEKGAARKPASNAAARAVGAGSSAAPATTQAATYSESIVNAMSASEYEKHEEKIEAAMREGKFVYDLSGAK